MTNATTSARPSGVRDAQERELDVDPPGVHGADEQRDQCGESDGEVEEEANHEKTG